MSEISAKSELVLARRLREEAAADRPDFSESLHRRAVLAIRRRRDMIGNIQATAASRATIAGHHILRLAVVLAAAAILAAVAIGVMPHAQPEPAGTSPIPTSLADLPLLPDLGKHTEQGWNELLAASGWTPHVEDLKHDARLAAEAMLSCLPHDIQVADNK
jgi:hypothetical protein